MDIKLEAIYFLTSVNLQDSESLVLQGNEKDMSDYIYANPEVIEEGFSPLSREEHIQYGFIDVFGYDKNNVLVVVECKRFKAGPLAVSQLRRYVEKIKSSRGLNKVRGIIAAPEITKPALQMLIDFGYAFKPVNPPKYKEEYKKNQKNIGDF